MGMTKILEKQNMWKEIRAVVLNLFQLKAAHFENALGSSIPLRNTSSIFNCLLTTEEIIEQFLCCREIRKTMTGQNIFNNIISYLKSLYT